MKAFSLVTSLLIFGAGAASAQEKSVDLHLNYSRGLTSHMSSWGAGGGVQVTLGGKNALIEASTSLGGDYLKQDNGGPGEPSASVDVNLQPGGNRVLTPYAGGSVSENWSTGAAKEWDGSRVGLEALGGIQFQSGSNANITWRAEERYGYIRGEEHSLGTRVGILVSF